jgi:hypothetical protein
MKRCIRVVWLWLLAWALVACGGGDGGSVVPTKSLNKPQVGRPHLTMKVTPSSFALTVEQGAQQDVSLFIEDVAFRSRSSPLYLGVASLASVFSPAPLVTSLGNGRYSVLLRTAASLAAGDYYGEITLRLCSETPCIRAITGGTVTVPYSIRIQGPATDLPDWETHQGTASHTGYVPLTLNPDRFAYAWEWRRSTSGEIGRAHV